MLWGGESPQRLGNCMELLGGGESPQRLGNCMELLGGGFESD